MHRSFSSRAMTLWINFIKAQNVYTPSLSVFNFTTTTRKENMSSHKKSLSEKQGG